MAKEGNKNAEGNKGGNGAPSVVDRELSKQVRNLALSKIKVILEKPVVEMNQMDKDLHDAVLLKLAGTVLPRLNEHTGEDGQPINVMFNEVFKSTRQANRDSKEPSKI